MMQTCAARRSGDQVRITTLGALYLFIQSLNKHYGVLVIEDFATAVNRAMGELDDLVDKHKVSVDVRRNRVILDFLKLMSLYCRKFNAVCVIVNSVDTFNMSFVQVNPTTSSSQQASQQKFYQKILVSALGEHPSWSSFFTSRIMLYKDWSQGGKTATFAHVRHNQTMKRLLQSQIVEPKVVCFTWGKASVKEVGGMEQEDFTLEGQDLQEDSNISIERETSFINGDEEQEGEDLCDDIQNARELLSSQILTNQGLGVLEDHTEGDKQDDALQHMVHGIVGRDQESKEPGIEFSQEQATASQPDDSSVQEIDDELEELFPTQPEAISIIKLSQILENSMNKRRPFTDEPAKRPKIDIVDETEIPATLPFF